jgi:DNA-binding transcriptional LysR family regulator
LSDLFARRLLIREPGSGSRLVLETALASVNATLGDFQQTLEIGNVEAIKDLVAQGLGVSFLYQRSVQKELDSGRLVRFRLEDLTVWHDYSFVRLKNSLQEPAYQQFLARLLKTESSSPGTRRTPEYPLDSKSLGR